MSLLAPRVLPFTPNLNQIMAAKKTAKKSTDSVPQLPAKPSAPAAKKAAKKAATKTAAKKVATVPAPKATKTAAKKVSSTPAPKAASKKPSFDEIARGAYLNYRSRIANGLPGDSHNDWLEAERKLGVIH